jgi:hypothetical protein
VARGDALKMAFEILRAPSDMGGELVRMLHGSERELKGHLHRSLSPLQSSAAFVRAKVRRTAELTATVLGSATRSIIGSRAF